MPTDEAPLRVGYTTGSWDPLEPRHINFLRHARQRCDRLVVGVISDDQAEVEEGHAPGFSLPERMALIGALEMVDDVVEDTSGDPLQAWRDLRFTILFLGTDRREAVPGDHLEAALRATGVEVNYLALTAHRVATGSPASGPSPVEPDNDSFRILFVCTANLCRSPMAEYILRQRVESSGLPWIVRSAGTHARPGNGMHPFAIQSLSRMGIETGDFVTTRVDEELLDTQDLILTMTSEQRSWVVNLVPRVTSCTYVLNSFAHLISAVPAAPRATPSDRGPELLQRAIRGRTAVQPLLGDRDIADPIGKSLRQFQSCARQLASVTDAFLEQRQGGLQPAE